jgi:hypothetical protein
MQSTTYPLLVFTLQIIYMLYIRAVYYMHPPPGPNPPTRNSSRSYIGFLYLHADHVLGSLVAAIIGASRGTIPTKRLQRRASQSHPGSMSAIQSMEEHLCNDVMREPWNFYAGLIPLSTPTD